MIEKLKNGGWKTYAVAAVGVVVSGLHAQGIVDDKTFEFIVYTLGFLGIGTLRHGVKKLEK